MKFSVGGILLFVITILILLAGGASDNSIRIALCSFVFFYVTVFLIYSRK